MDQGSTQRIIHPETWTFWTKNGGGWKMIFLFKQVTFRFNVNFQGSIAANITITRYGRIDCFLALILEGKGVEDEDCEQSQHHWFRHLDQETRTTNTKTLNWLVVSTPLKNISQNGNLPQVEVKTKKWIHHLVKHQHTHTQITTRARTTRTRRTTLPLAFLALFESMIFRTSLSWFPGRVYS